MATAGDHGTPPVSLSAGLVLYDAQNGNQLVRLATFVENDGVMGFLTSGFNLREARRCICLLMCVSKSSEKYDMYAWAYVIPLRVSTRSDLAVVVTTSTTRSTPHK